MSYSLRDWLIMNGSLDTELNIYTELYSVHLSCMHMMQEKHSLPKGTIISYMHMDLQWFNVIKPMIYGLLVFKQVTRNEIFDSSSAFLKIWVDLHI